MIPTKAPLFELLSARMRWLGERQAVLGQNIANADTPGYRPKDLREDAFAWLVEGTAGASRRLPQRLISLQGGRRFRAQKAAAHVAP